MQRSVSFRELFNFRDLGGYATADGRTVAWRRLYRADDLGRLRGADRDRFAALGIRTVIDLRRPAEVAEAGRVPEIAGVAYHGLHLIHPTWPPQEVAALAERTGYLVARYGEMAAAGGDAIGAALRLVAEAEAAPLVVHCFAGKDRTGIVSALVLALLGVPDETIAADYAHSEASDARYRSHHGRKPAGYVVAPAAAMLTFLAALRAEHGSVDAYVTTVGVGRDHITAMRAHLLT